MTEEFFADQPHEVRVFHDAADFIRKYDSQTDILFLDIQMPLIDGLTCAERVRQLDPDVILIFVTSMIQYAVQGYRVEAFDYIVKPVTQTRLSLSLNRALKRLRRKQADVIAFRASDGLRSLSADKIRFIEAINHRCVIHTADEKIPCPQTLSSLEKQMNSNSFYRCHSAFLINMKYIDRIDGCDLHLGDHLIPISKHRHREFMQALTQYWGKNT